MMRTLLRAIGFVLAGGAILHLFRSPAGSLFPAAGTSGGYERRALGLAILALLGLLALAWSRFVSSDAEEESPSRGRLLAQTAGFTLAGAGAALSLEAIARHARSLVTTAPVDFTILGTALLILGFFGALAFAPLFESEKRRVLAVALGSLACALFCIVSIRTLNGLATPQGFDAYVRQFGLRASQRGYFTFSALLGGTLFALPAFALGTAAARAKGREITMLLVGGALGLMLVPRLLSSTDLSDPVSPSPFSAGLVRVGILLAAIGAALAIASMREAKGKTRLIGLSLAGAGLAAAFIVPLRPIVISSPWQRRPAQPVLAIDAPHGLFVVDGATAGFAHASLDGRALTPQLKNAGLDAAVLETSIALLPAEVRSRELNVLVVGVLSPGRALALGSKSHHRSDGDLLRGPARLGTGSFSSPLGIPSIKRVMCSLRSLARERIAAAKYDLVLAPPLEAGRVPTTPAGLMSSAPKSTTFVFWIDATNSNVGAAPLGVSSEGRAILASDGLERFAIGMVGGPAVRDFGETLDSYGSRPQALLVGKPVSSLPLSRWLSTRIHRKGRMRVELLAERLGRANIGRAAEKLTMALARAAALQDESSPFADEAASIEIDEQALTLLREAALEQTPDFFTARFIEEMGRTLLDKGWIEETHNLLEPIAARYAPRPQLETLLAEAEIDGLLFADAIARLDRISGPEGGAQLLLRSRALTGLGHPEQALPILRRVKLEGLSDPRTVRLELATTLAELDPVAALAELSELAKLIGHDDELERIEEELRARFALEGVEVPEPESVGHDHPGHEDHDH